MDYTLQDFYEYLFSLGETDYKDFSSKLIRDNLNIIGIRTPKLKIIAKTIVNKGPYEDFLEIDDKNIYEIIMLKLLVISYIKDIAIYKKYFIKFIPKITNWALCDTFISNSKIIKKDKNYFYKYACNLVEENDEFKNRIGFVILMDYFVEDTYINNIYKIIDNYKSDYYYANMALAWLVSVLYIKYCSNTKEYLLNSKLDIDVVNMAKRKIKDSYRVSPENKEWLKKVGS